MAELVGDPLHVGIGHDPMCCCGVSGLTHVTVANSQFFEALIPQRVQRFGGRFDVEKAARVFVANELEPLQERFRELNERMGREVVRFNEYSLPVQHEGNI